MAFTPADTRREQLAAAETLLLELDPRKAYPHEFVVFRITGFRPKQELTGELLTGLALQHDLGLLIEQVSDTLDEQAKLLGEPVLLIEDVAARFSVADKTIQRWRRRGLAARKFIFPGGKRRVGFLLSSVERFLSAHGEQVSRGTNFSQVGDAERDEIVRRARRLAVGCRCCIREITRRLGRRFNRSPLTILHTIRKFDQEHPEAAVFPLAPEPVSDLVRLRILRAHRRGQPLRAIARRVHRPSSSVYGVVLDERAARLSKRKTKFIDDPIYHLDNAEQLIEDMLRGESIAPETSSEESRVPRDLPPELQSLYREPLLSPSRERALFLKFNYRKYQFAMARRRLDPQLARARDLDRLERLLRLAAEVKNEIVRANLRLVVSVARKHLRPGLDLMELVSEGSVTLMRAVESFDVHKGFRFSTYATLALMKAFARGVPELRNRLSRAGDIEALDSVPDHRAADDDARMVRRDEVRQLLSRLTERERSVVQAHYGLDVSEKDRAARPATLAELADRLGLSKQRVRMIEQSAIAKLRRAALESARP
jgi:RNA polymerase sigma factor (sigma-70 family)